MNDLCQEQRESLGRDMDAENAGRSEEGRHLEITVGRWEYKTFKYTGLLFLFIGLYFILSSIDVFSSPVIDPSAGLLLIFATGLLTSAHCMGMCSGFVFAYSTKASDEPEGTRSRMRQHIVYNVSRLGSYTGLGTLAGTIGAIFMFTNQYRGYLSVFAGGFMMLYGLSIFFPRLRRFVTIRTPNLTKHTRNRGPVVFGLLNGFMPCGPLQAMLIYAASTGSALQGGLTMMAFGLGTIPLMFTFGNALSFFTRTSMRRIVKLSAIIIMTLGLVTLNRGMLLSGYSLPLPTFDLNTLTSGGVRASGMVAAAGLDGYQEIDMTVDRYGWNPDTFVVKKGVPVRWNIYVEKLTYCYQGIRFPKYGLGKDFTREGETVTLEFTPEEEGTFLFTCWMGMARGDIIVKEDVSGPLEPQRESKPGLAVIKIRGMCCSGCARYIQSQLLGVDGVKSAEVSYETRKARIDFDPAKTSVEGLISTIESTGRYDAEEV